jgi:glycogen(starch) synthase
LLIPNENNGINQSVVNNFNVYRDLEEKLDEAIPEIKSRLIHFLIHKERIVSEGFFDKNEFLEMQKLLKRLIVENVYPISTHNLKSDDEVLKILSVVGLRNLPDDKVKIIYYPSYLRRGDGLLNLDYDEIVSGCHLGIFPSLYEPWGYTPLETAASGVITITTDLTGFADFIKKNIDFNQNVQGVYILKRKNRRDSDVVEDLSNLMLGIAKLNKSLRVENKLEARRIASYCSWDKLINYYLELYNIALKKFYI